MLRKAHDELPVWLLGMLLQTPHPEPPTDPDQLEAQYKSVPVCATITCVRLGEAFQTLFLVDPNDGVPEIMMHDFL